MKWKFYLNKTWNVEGSIDFNSNEKIITIESEPAKKIENESCKTLKGSRYPSGVKVQKQSGKQAMI